MPNQFVCTCVAVPLRLIKLLHACCHANRHYPLLHALLLPNHRRRQLFAAIAAAELIGQLISRDATWFDPLLDLNHAAPTAQHGSFMPRSSLGPPLEHLLVGLPHPITHRIRSAESRTHAEVSGESADFSIQPSNTRMPVRRTLSPNAWLTIIYSYHWY